MTQISPKPSDQNASNGYNNGTNGHNNGDIFDTDFGSELDLNQLTAPAKVDAFSQPERTSSAQVMPQENKKLTRWQRTSLRTKMTLAALALGVLPVAAIGTLAFNLADRQIINQVTTTKEAGASAVGQQIAIIMRERYADIKTLAELNIIYNPSGRENTPYQEKQAQLDEIVADSQFYDGIAVADLKGNIILKSSGENATTLSDRNYFQTVVKTKKPVITEPQISKVTKIASVFVAAPVFDSASGQFIAVVRTRTPVENITKILKDFAANGQEYFILDSSGKVILANDKARIGKEANAQLTNIDKLIAAKKPGSTLSIDKVDGKEELASYAPFPTIEGLPDLGWSTLLHESTDQAYAAQYLLLWSLGLGTLAVALGVGALAAYAANRATRPLLAASETVAKLGKGEFDNRVEVTGSDEIAVLGSNINKMADQVQELLKQQEVESDQARLFADIASTRADNVQEVEKVFNQALAGAKDILKADRVVIYRFKPDWSGYIANESVSPGFPVALNDKIEDPCIGDKLIEAYKNGRVVATGNVFEAGFHPQHINLMERLQVMANLVTPIINNNELYGLLIAHHCIAPHAWQESEIKFLQQMSEKLGAVLSRVSFLEQKEAEAKRSQLLKDITVSIGQSFDPREIFNQAVQEARRAIASDRVVIYSFNDQWQGTVTAESVGEGWPKAIGARIDDPCFADRYVERYRAGRVQATNNIYKAGLTECHIKQLSTFAVQANLVAPILQGGKLLGLLIAHQCSAPRNWQQVDIDLFSQLATQVGFALDRANLLEQQKTAREFLQKRALELLIEVDPLSRGDLTIRASVTEDEIGTVADSYNSTIGSLRKIVSQVQQAAIQVAATTTNNQGSVQGLSTEALRQTEEIASALEQVQQMSESIRAVAANASQAEAAVQQATATVQAGDAAMNRTVDGILAIRETVAETSKKVKRLGESSQKISKVVNLIGTFADQTNLLALNASIEAAHAGEQGRGFAVVADEVRVLARQSAAATAEIEALVKDIQTETNEVVAAMEAGTEQVVTGTKLVDETRQSLNKISAVSTEISSLVAAIASAAVAQTKASDSVSHTMTDVAQIAGKTSSEAANVSASFKELLEVAQDLQATVGQFKVK
ncbi:methyl-accepting chemotaxis protein [Aliterella atlantica]|uniref:Chemotaxis protein CheD n=1 Tax=Aliterella atlantica CENA595 TaxID=1618023 RepID=A0A0D8ZM98_9CYAN|nr:methyl-accepting chemotaxis protein [Aliterella atlantica]KJH69953.1 chemotaxis protein CheD [Aliterella atlantica CENA595]